MTSASTAQRGYVMYDQAGDCTVADPAFCEIVGRDVEDLIGTQWSLLTDDERAEITVQSRVATEGRMERFRRPDGSDAVTLVKCAPVELPEERRAYPCEVELLATSKDLTPLQQAGVRELLDLREEVTELREELCSMKRCYEDLLISLASVLGREKGCGG